MKSSAYFLLGLITIASIVVTACGGTEPTLAPTVASDVVDAPTVPDIPGLAGADFVKKGKRARPHISTIGDTIQFDIPRLQETAIYSATATFTSALTINKHNWVLAQPGSKDAIAAAGVEAREANSWIQSDGVRVIALAKLLDSGKSDEVKFTAQIAKIYRWVCTFPGHNASTFGEFKFL